MSADNWAICPRCELKRAEHLAALDIDLADAYGKVPIEEFDRLRAERNAEATKKPEATFREDYEIWGIEDGEFHVSYSGGCRECGLSHEFKHDAEVKVRNQ